MGLVDSAFRYGARLQAAAAAEHRFFERDELLDRMLPVCGRGRGTR